MNEPEASVPQPVSKDYPWLRYLTGLRGLAALYVLLCHLVGSALRGSNEALPDRWYSVFLLADMGVSVFMVLSGYCLMLPIVSRPECKPKTGWFWFFVRRARRILPTYYLAMAVSLCLIYYRVELEFERDDSFSRESIVSHLLLYQNYSSRGLSIGGTLWSIATECQIYLLMPIIVWAWRRGGKVPVILFLSALSPLPHQYFPDYWYSKFHFLICYLLGCLAADVVHRPGSDKTFWWRLPWRDIALCGSTVVVSVMTYAHGWALGHTSDVELDVFVAAVTCALLVSMGQQRAGRSVAANVLGSPIFYGLGLMSYSMYLIQQPLLDIAFNHSARLPWNGDFPDHVYFAFCLHLPLLLLCSYVFYLVAERPFLSRGADRLTLPWPSVLKSAEPVFVLPPGAKYVSFAWVGVALRFAAASFLWVPQRLYRLAASGYRIVVGTLVKILYKARTRMASKPRPKVSLWQRFVDAVDDHELPRQVEARPADVGPVAPVSQDLVLDSDNREERREVDGLLGQSG